MDLIGRQDAIEAIQNVRYRLADVTMRMINAVKRVPSAQPERPEQPESAKEYCAECDHAEMCQWYPYEGCEFRSLPSAQQWVSVSERLPEANEEDENNFNKAYLVQDGRWMDVARWDGEYWVAWGYGTVLKNVIAWMPLPKPYRPKERQADV